MKQKILLKFPVLVSVGVHVALLLYVTFPTTLNFLKCFKIFVCDSD